MPLTIGMQGGQQFHVRKLVVVATGQELDPEKVTQLEKLPNGTFDVVEILDLARGTFRNWLGVALMMEIEPAAIIPAMNLPHPPKKIGA